MALLGVVFLFAVTRLANVTAFPIFNDEAIYLQYAQVMHEDWEANKFVSMNGQYNDWKPPLQFWLAAPFIQLGNDPLVVGRLVTIVFSFAGLLGFYAFAKEIFGEAEGVLTAFLYLLCPTVFLHNDQFTAESFLFSTAPLFYWTLLRATRANAERWLWAAAAVGAGVTLLLLKQSGFLIMILALALPMANFGQAGRRNWRTCALDFVFIGAVIVLAFILAKLALPSEFDATRAQFDRRWVMTMSELLRLPFDNWIANVRLVGHYVGAYYSWAMPLLLAPLFFATIQKRRGPEIALFAMAIGGGGAILVMLRGFNEYMFNTAVIALLLPLLARALMQAATMTKTGRGRFFRFALLALGACTILHWSFQAALMMTAPGRYIARSTPWAIANYLNGWPTGFGVAEVVDRLAQIEGPGVILLDPQWGNPRTALEVYAKRRFPQLKIVPMGREFMDPAQAQQIKARAQGFAPVRLAIFSANHYGARAVWQEIIGREMCSERTEIKGDPRQMPIVVCRF